MIEADAESMRSMRYLPEPKERHFAESLYKSRFKRIYYEKIRSVIIKHLDIPHASQPCFEFAFRSAFTITLGSDITIPYTELHLCNNTLKVKYKWDISAEDFHAHLFNIIELTSDLWHEAPETTE